jgi:tRNA G10  N-methylase Trm11
VFVPGKNWKLSLAEIAAFFEARNLKLRMETLSEAFFAVDSEEILEASMIDDLGGTIKIGRILARVPLETVERAFVHGIKQDQEELRAKLSAVCASGGIFGTLTDKCLFGVSLYLADQHFARHAKRMHRFVGSCVKEELASEGVKARFMGFPRRRNLPQLTHVEVLKKGFIERSAEILFCLGKKKAFIAKTVAVHNPFEFQKRDIGRPVQRRIFSIPPRLAKIMVNLSLCTRDKVLLDPFCGVGTILQEALLLKAQVAGLDMNPWCVKASLANLDWIKEEYGLDRAVFKVVPGDARKLAGQIGEEAVDCIVAEPDLGPVLRHVPTEAFAKRIVERLKPLYWAFLREAHRTLRSGRRLVLATPLIRTRKGVFVRLNMQERAKAVGFEQVCPFGQSVFSGEALLSVEDLADTVSFVDMEERHKIGREIHILRKI